MEIEEQEWYLQRKRKMKATTKGIELTEKEERFISWLARMEPSSVESFCSIVTKIKSQEKSK